MRTLVVIHSDTLADKGKVIKDALGKVREGWFVFEDGMPGYPYKTREQAIRQAEALKSIRCAPHVNVKVVEQGTER